ncbi:MAG: hypothetical protein CMK32_07775 [Porticoccaceae bacterium]|nr:hypothetical protein [Porticoccaceae bacterium]
MSSFALHKYQKTAVDRLLNDGQLGLLWDMGVGKTLTSLSAVDNWPIPLRTLIIAPKRCCTRVWPTEIEKFGFDLDVSLLLGTPKQRLKALDKPADVKVINPEGINWLYETCKKAKDVPFDALLVDESTEFKNATGIRFKALKQLIPHIPVRMILTGTPIPQSYADLWAQIFILDQGKRLGKNITEFRRRYCYRDYWKKWHVNEFACPEIDELISDIVSRIDAADHLDMPDLRFNRVVIELPKKVKEAYDQGLWELQNEDPEIGFDSTGASFTRVRTLCSGFAYVADEINPDAPQETKWLHKEKVDAIGEIHAGIGHKPLLVAFNFRAEREALVEKYKCDFIDGTTSSRQGDNLVDKWCRGELSMLAIHPGAVKYGLNMQSGGNHLAWISLPTSLADWQQTNARLYRQGQKDSVTIHSVIAHDTVDARLINLMESKETTQDAFLRAMKDAVNA